MAILNRQPILGSHPIVPLVVYGFLLVFTSTTEAAVHRNVLLLISDNQNWNDVGCYGHRVLKTPHLDRLAREGTRFEFAFATTASCGPSRAVIYSGLLTHQNGQYGHPQHYHNYHVRPEVQTIFSLLKANGYQTGLIGKANVNPPEQYPLDFQPKLSPWDVSAMARAAEEFFQQAEDQPFLLVMGYQDPHPTSRDWQSWGIRRGDKAVRPVHYDPKDVVVPRYLPDRLEVRANLAGYYQQISRLDQGIGMVLSALKKSGRADETLILFTSDHGSSEPGAMANHYEPGVRVPLIVKSPQQTKRGLTTDALVTLVDLVPTILNWTGTQGPAYKLPGRSILPVLEQEHPDGWDKVYLSHVSHELQTYYPMRTIRTRRYKLIWNLVWRQEYPLPLDTIERATWREVVRRGDQTIGRRSVEKFLFRDPLELYDLKSDPDEVINLADDPKYASIRKELADRLFDFLKRTNDPWLLRHKFPTGPAMRAAMRKPEAIEQANDEDYRQLKKEVTIGLNRFFRSASLQSQKPDTAVRAGKQKKTAP